MTTIQRSPRTRKHPDNGGKIWMALRNSDRVRWTRVMAAQARIASGYYERDEVKEFVVDAIWEELRRH